MCEELERLKDAERTAISRLESAQSQHTFMPANPSSDPEWQEVERRIRDAERRLEEARERTKLHQKEHGC